MDRPRRSVLVAIGLLAAAIMLFEIALTRVLSFSIWHHFAFMVISVALLGFGASGIALHRRPSLGQPPEERASVYALLFGATALTAVAVLVRVPFDASRVALDRLQIAYLLFHYVALVVPFAFAGLALVTLLQGFRGAVDRLYGCDLIGAGLGCVVVVGALSRVGAQGVVVASAAAAATSAWLLRSRAVRGEKPRLALPWLIAALASSAAIPWASRLLPIPPPPGKALSQCLDSGRFPDARIAYTEWNALSRVDAVEGTGTAQWTENPRADRTSPPQVLVFIDGDAITPIVAATDPGSGELDFLGYTLSSAALQAFRPAEVLVIGSGGGVDVLTALRHGARSVDAVEINPLVVDLVTGRYADWSGRLFARPAVRLHGGEGRAFVRQQPLHRYDAIQLSLIDTWAATASGAYSLSESYLYTVEAFEDYLTRLSDRGVLTVTRWRLSPPREDLRLCTVADAALRRMGIARPAEHVVVLSLGNFANVLVKRTPFTKEEVNALRAVAQARKFEFLYAPEIAGDNPFIGLFRASDRAEFLSRYPYDVTPSTDESPFFFQFGRWRDVKWIGAGWGEHPILLSGRLVVSAVLVQAVILSVVLLVGPLVRRGRPASMRVLVYFFLIGLSFMLLEITLMQRFTLFLGHPVYAIVLVLAVLLVAAGAGSLASATIAATRYGTVVVFTAIVGLTFAYAVGLPALFRSALATGLPGRMTIGAGLLAPLGFLLGVPFPVGLRRLVAGDAAPAIGWAWAANGCASVLGPIAAVLLAMDFGFLAVMVAAAIGYAGAFAVLARR